VDSGDPRPRRRRVDRAAGCRARAPYRRPTLKWILAWAERAHEASECPDVHRRIFTHLDDERRARLASIRALEGEWAAMLVRTPYVLLRERVRRPCVSIMAAGVRRDGLGIAVGR
jgi:hypothetical protein